MSRDARPLADRFPGRRVVAADLLDPRPSPPALEGVTVAYYLAHSMGAGERGFAERDRQAARNFAQAAKRAAESPGSSISAAWATTPRTSPTTWPAATRRAPSSPPTGCRSPSSGRP